MMTMMWRIFAAAAAAAAAAASLLDCGRVVDEACAPTEGLFAVVDGSLTSVDEVESVDLVVDVPAADVVRLGPELHAAASNARAKPVPSTTRVNRTISLSRACMNEL
ncbi:MAG TPA: hypothetical protein VKJ07_19435 [Mycobacteriales bacterium]|nr:hypothetical protein [Mycobacteriales bacterium]